MLCHRAVRGMLRWLAIATWLMICCSIVFPTAQADGNLPATQAQHYFSSQEQHSDEILGPDLAVVFASPQEIRLSPGKEVFISDEIVNFGCSPSPPVVVRYFISRSPDLDLSTAHAVGERDVPALQPGIKNGSGGTHHYPLPVVLLPEKYYLFACVDPDNNVSEISEDNNCSGMAGREYVSYQCGPRRTDAQQARLDSFGREVFEPGLRGLEPKSRTVAQGDLLSRFGKPTDVTVRKELHGDLPSDGYMRMIWEADGLVFEMIAAPEKNSGDDPKRKLWVEKIELSGSQYTLKHGLKIGMPRKSFVALLGNPDSESDDSKRLSYNSEQPVFQIEIKCGQDDKVEKIIWAWYWH